MRGPADGKGSQDRHRIIRTVRATTRTAHEHQYDKDQSFHGSFHGRSFRDKFTGLISSIKCELNTGQG